MIDPHAKGCSGPGRRNASLILVGGHERKLEELIANDFGIEDDVKRHQRLCFFSLTRKTETSKETT